MGLEIHTTADIPERGAPKRRLGRDVLFAEITRAIEAAVGDPLHRRLIDLRAHEHTLAADLHPAGASLRFEWAPEGAVTAEVKTSTAGPGFHAFVIYLLDAVAERCGLEWQWLGAGDEGPTDETDYVFSHDFPALQGEMAEFLRHLSQSLFRFRNPDYSSGAINMPLGYPSLCDVDPASPVIATPMGPFARQWFEALGAQDEAGLIDSCRRFYPWWNHERDAAFYLNCALTMAWTDLPWHPPISRQEFDRYRLVLDLFARARELDPAVALPEAEIREIERFITVPITKPDPPHAAGIGYRRRMLTHHLTGPWTIRLPGYYYEKTDDRDSTLVFHYGGRTVRFSSFAIEPPDGRPRSPDELLPKNLPPDFRRAERLAVDAPKMKGEAFFLQTRDRNGPYWVLQGGIAAENTVAMVTICYRDDADKPWAISTFQSVSGPWTRQTDL